MKIHGVGCSLVDNLYSPIDFTSKQYLKWLPDSNRDVGIITGGLVFGEDLELASGIPYSDIIHEITNGLKPQQNIGGPAIVALIHMSQIIKNKDIEIAFFGARSNDIPGRYLEQKLSGFNIILDNYIITEGRSSFTDVLSDPAFNENNGERTFINYIGAAGEYGIDNLPISFFDADILIFGGTALTPGIHDDLSEILKRGKLNGCMNFINTVYDFRSQKKNPGKPWPVVECDDDFRFIDLFVSDNEEAVRISGESNKENAARFFISKGVKGGIITHGAEDIVCFSNGSFFREEGIFTLPVSKEAGRRMKALSSYDADTTGCGDNFAGGVYASVVQQLSEFPGSPPSLKKAAVLGIVSGGFAGLYLGGVFYEKHKYEKAEKLQMLLDAYSVQTGENCE